MFEDSEDKKEKGEFAIRSNSCETPIRETTQEDINDLMDSVHEVNDYRLSHTNNKPIPTEDTARSL